jgi:hypothetical protein
MVLLSEVVQTFILADFWWVGGRGVCGCQEWRPQQQRT